MQADGLLYEALDPEPRTEEFLARIQAGELIEPGDWMPETYRALNRKVVEMNANSELTGALLDGEWVPKAPTLWRKRTLASKVQDEIGHAHLVYSVAESLGRPRQQVYLDLVEGRGKCHNVVHYPTYTWGDAVAIGLLVDGAAIVTQKAFERTSYGPYARVMKRINVEESLHYRHGEDMTLEMLGGTDEQVEMLQSAIERWWWPTMAFFGTDLDPERDPLIAWGIKPQSNETSRQQFLTRYVPKLWDVGVELPDPELRWDADEECWRYTEPDWGEFRQLARAGSGNGTGRLEKLRQRFRDGAWLREDTLHDSVPVVAA